MELAYAAALGQREGVSISAAEAAGRHDFGRRSERLRRHGALAASAAGHRRSSAPGASAARFSDWMWSSPSSRSCACHRRPPSTKPSLSDDDRRVFIEAVALVEPASLTDADRDTIVAAIRKGRARLTPRAHAGRGASRSPTRFGLSPAAPHAAAVGRRARARAGGRLPVAERAPLARTRERRRLNALHAWGAPGEPRMGCLCLQMIDRRPWESFAGRRNAGMLASAFPDLNLRLAELLAELNMPAALLGPVLASATLDFVNTVTSRDPDDRRGLVEFVQALRAERVEQYLALLTTDGPLVPIESRRRRTATDRRRDRERGVVAMKGAWFARSRRPRSRRRWRRAPGRRPRSGSRRRRATRSSAARPGSRSVIEPRGRGATVEAVTLLRERPARLHGRAAAVRLHLGPGRRRPRPSRARRRHPGRRTPPDRQPAHEGSRIYRAGPHRSRAGAGHRHRRADNSCAA